MLELPADPGTLPRSDIERTDNGDISKITVHMGDIAQDEAVTAFYASAFYKQHPNYDFDTCNVNIDVHAGPVTVIRDYYGRRRAQPEPRRSFELEITAGHLLGHLTLLDVIYREPDIAYSVLGTETTTIPTT